MPPGFWGWSTSFRPGEQQGRARRIGCQNKLWVDDNVQMIVYSLKVGDKRSKIKRFHMKQISLAGLITLAMLLLVGCAGGTAGEITTLIHRAGEKYAPDNRLSVWNISVDRTGRGWVLRGETTSGNGLKQVQSAIRARFPDIRMQSGVVVLPDPGLADTTGGIVSVTVANIRRDPSRQAELVSQTVMGAPVDLLKRESGFYFCRLEDGYLGWIPSESILPGDSTFVRKWVAGPVVIFREKYGTIYQRPNATSTPVADMVMAARLQQVSGRGDWLEVRLPDGRTGFLPRDQVIDFQKLQTRSPDGQSLVQMARQMLGISYLWGGTSSKGFDCSGFTQTVFLMNGLDLPRDASMQVQEGVPVDTTDGFRRLRAGDLLFFGSTREHITHVGMYIGNGQFIHESGRVKINSLFPEAPDYSAYRARTLRVVKRMF